MRNTAIIAFFCLLATNVTIAAHESAIGTVKQRMDAMENIAGRMKILGGMMKKQTDFDPTAAANAAEIIADHAPRMPGLFPEGSDKRPSEALPVIWTDWTGFEAMAEELNRSASELSAATGGGGNAGEIAAKFGKIARTCKSRHEKYRLKK